MQVKSKNPVLAVLIPVVAGVAAYWFADASQSVRVILGLLAFAVFSVQSDLLNVRKALEERI